MPLEPDVSDLAFDIDPSANYAVLISMYEVYNDRIFDLLSTPTPVVSGVGKTVQHPATAIQRDLQRRPLLFKSTEMSSGRKVVAGLRKILCKNLEEAMLVLQTGLAERRVAGTGSNTASSRSHGFFCLEVKRRYRSEYSTDHQWSGKALSIVDLAGSERARNTKTTGATLAEAGKINESLMYLGQCLQVQSEQHDGSRPVVPFRQCKLTELLFSNSLSPDPNGSVKWPQKAVMIVTADPNGDFNATSQILRYSALAKEVTVPRMPSTNSTITTGPDSKNRRAIDNAASIEQHASSIGLQQAAVEMARLSEECEQLHVRLAEEEIRRSELELQIQALTRTTEEKATAIEQDVRNECWAQMESEMEAEKERWRCAQRQERLRSEDIMAEKIQILEKGASLRIGDNANYGVSVETERENLMLRTKLQELQRQLNLQTPTKASKKRSDKTAVPLQENMNPASFPFLSHVEGQNAATWKTSINTDAKSSILFENSAEAQVRKVDQQHTRVTSVQKTPGTIKKVRKLTTRKWDLGEAGDDDSLV